MEENIALYEELRSFLKEEKSDYKSLILGEDEVNWAYKILNGTQEIVVPLPDKYHKVFYALRRKQTANVGTPRKLTVPAVDEDSEYEEDDDDD